MADCERESHCTLACLRSHECSVLNSPETSCSAKIVFQTASSISLVSEMRLQMKGKTNLITFLFCFAFGSAVGVHILETNLMQNDGRPIEKRRVLKHLTFYQIKIKMPTRAARSTKWSGILVVTIEWHRETGEIYISLTSILYNLMTPRRHQRPTSDEKSVER